MSSDHSAVSVHEHPPPSFGVPNLKLAFWLFLASDCMLFGSLIATYLSYRGKDQLFGNGPYPLDLFSVEVTTISTFDLLMSSVTMVLAVAAIQRGNMFQTRLWLALTALLGAIFVGFQGYEFTHFYLEGLKLQGNLFGSTFYVLTGFHGTHVTLGVVWLLLVLATTFTKHKSMVTHLNVEVAGLYWHFVDIVWIVIFTLVYLMEYTV
ncbi:heme-copper oxidase subunit III [Myxococcota bacterium]|nr:heme-copper oxidase subunit III [Myxococcota bacterium]